MDRQSRLLLRLGSASRQRLRVAEGTIGGEIDLERDDLRLEQRVERHAPGNGVAEILFANQGPDDGPADFYR